MNSLMKFDFDNNAVRIVPDDKGEPMFVAKDLVEAVDAVWNGSLAVSHVPDEWRGVRSVLTPSGTHDMTVLTEQGMYFYLIRSDKPKALPLQKMVAGEVLPSIRKTGQYRVAPQTTAEWMLEQAQAFVEQERRIAANEARVALVEDRLDQIQTASEFYTVLGWFSRFSSHQLPLHAASVFGRQATAYCKSNEIAMGNTPDPRFGQVNTYPKDVLDHLFGHEYRKAA